MLGIPDGTTLLLDGDAGIAPGRSRRPRRCAAAERRRERDLAPARAPPANTRHEPAITRDGDPDRGVRQPRRGRRGGPGGGARRRGRRPAAHRVPVPGARPRCPTRTSRRRRCAEIAVALDGRPLVVRTLDAGADKPLPALPMPARGQPVPRRARYPPLAPAPRRAGHPVPRDPARRRRPPGQGDAADGGDAGRGPGRSRRCSTQARARHGITARWSWGSWSRCRRRR